MTDVSFTLESIPLDALVDLANAASKEINRALNSGADYSFNDLDERFNTIVAVIERRTMIGTDVTGEPIASDWDITAHVVCPNW